MTKMNKFLKQARDMQKKMETLQAELADSLIEVEAAGGAIEIQITGDQKIHRIKIAPRVVDPEDVEGLEDLILTACNQAIQESKEYSENKTQEITGDVQLPGGLNL